MIGRSWLFPCSHKNLLPSGTHASQQSPAQIREGLVATIDISPFRSRDELAGHCGVAPAGGQSGTSPSPASPGRGGNRGLESLLVFPCDSLVGTKNGFGACCDDRRARGMRRNKALEAVAGKRVEAICSIMGDPRPCEERAA